MPIPPRIKTTALTGLEAALNAYLKLDPMALGRLSRLAGKVIAIELRGLNIIFYLLPDKTGISVRGAVGASPDTTLRGTPWSLMRLGLAKNQQGLLFSGEVDIFGDMETGQRFKEILDAMDIDWEEQLSKVVSDVVAHKVGNVVRGIQDWSTQAIDSLNADITEYMQEESQLLPRREEVDEFLSSVDTLRADVDRLEKRVARLRQNLRGDAG
ncbi:MAG TPA: SCP2 sterol-binding domain-containing protein [Gammaproteobacteria bacterium]